MTDAPVEIMRTRRSAFALLVAGIADARRDRPDEARARLEAERTLNVTGDAAATSFFPAKPLGCYGDGGACFTNDDGLAEVLRSLRMHGQGSDRYEHVRVGVNSRLDTIQAAVLLEKLRGRTRA